MFFQFKLNLFDFKVKMIYLEQCNGENLERRSPWAESPQIKNHPLNFETYLQKYS